MGLDRVLVDKLQARGYAADVMHGDMNQAQRETVIRPRRDGHLEIVAATNIAARGLRFSAALIQRLGI